MWGTRCKRRKLEQTRGWTVDNYHHVAGKDMCVGFLCQGGPMDRGSTVGHSRHTYNTWIYIYTLRLHWTSIFPLLCLRMQHDAPRIGQSFSCLALEFIPTALKLCPPHCHSSTSYPSEAQQDVSQTHTHPQQSATGIPPLPVQTVTDDRCEER